MINRSIVVLVTLLAGFAMTQPSVAMTTPTETVRTTIDGVLATLSDNSLDEQGKRQAALAQITDAFDFTGMSQRILATNWKKANDQQRQRFVELFTDILANTYWSRIKAYSDQVVEVVGEKIKNEKSARVKTLIKTGTQEIPVDYSLGLRDDRWLAYDVVIEGVSLVRNYRSSYQQIARKDGIDGLLGKMQQKVDDNASL